MRVIKFFAGIGAAVLLTAVGQLWAVNGVGVFTCYHCPQSQEQWWSAENMFWRGKIVKVTIQNNQVTGRDTLFGGLGCYPAFSYDGARIAFFRWGIQVQYSGGAWHDVAGTSDDSCYLSVVNTNGSGGVRNLIAVPYLGDWQRVGESSGMLDWPAGDWIFYEKPTKTGQIWRVNVNDPSKNELVCSYPASTGIRMWSMSVDAKWVGTQCWVTGSWVHNGIHSFPLTNNSISSSVNAGLAGCNASVSCGGNRVSHYVYAPHRELYAEFWNKSTGSFDWGKTNESTIANVETWLGQSITMPGRGGADQVRWSVNSEKWAMRAIGWCDQAEAMRLGSNSVAVNWKDHQAINLSHIPAPADCNGNKYGYGADAGDLWIDFGAGNEGKWEDENGVMNYQAPLQFGSVSLRTDIARAGSNELVVNEAGVSIVTTDDYRVRVLDASGRLALESRGHGPAFVGLPSLRNGVYAVQAVAGNRGVSERLVVADR